MVRDVKHQMIYAISTDPDQNAPEQSDRHNGSVVERPLCDRDVAGSIPGQTKDFKNGTSCTLAWR